MSLFVPLGVIAALAGLVMVIKAIRQRRTGEDPRNTAMLIGGTMLTAFGVVIAGFVLAYNAAAPLDLNAGEAR
jgi:hypothetical protein